MVETFLKTAKMFIEEWKERDNPALISFVITGGGFSILDIGKIPGSSGVLSSAFVPYSNADTINFAEKAISSGEKNPLADDSIKFVGPEATELYSKALLNTVPYSGLVQVVINASLTTTRWRRGKNEAYIWIRDENGKVTKYHYEMRKLSESDYNKMTPEYIERYRLSEDILIASVVISLLADPLSNPVSGDLETLTILGEEVPCHN